MLLNESEIRKVIRNRLILEKAKELEQSGGEIAGDVAMAGAAGLATGAGITAGLGAVGATTAAGAAASIATASGAAGATTAALSAGFLSGGGAASGAAAALASGPPGWAIGAGIAVGLGVAYILLDEGDVGGDVEAILNGSWGEKTNAELKKTEEETKAKLKEAGMEEQLAKFPSLTHYNDVMDLHSKMAKRLYRATKGGFFGMGTDEGEIEAVIRDMPSLMDLSLTAASFKQQYKKDLAKVFNEELSDEESLAFTGDMEDYVRKPIQDLKNKAVICFKDGNGEKKCYSEQELKAFSKEVEELLKNPPKNKVEIVPIDPNTLPGNLVKRIQNVMNRYNDLYKIGSNIAEDGKWGPNTDKLWEKYLNHAFTNHSTFKTLAYAKTYQSGMYQWTQVSGDMISKFPGYTPDMRGCLAFVVDGYNGDTAYGSGEKKISGGGSGGGGLRRKVKSDDVDDQAVDIPGGGDTGQVGTGLVPDVRITLAGPGKTTLESIGFPENTSNGLVSTVATRVRGTITGGVINLTVVVNKDGRVRNVRVAPGQRRNPINRQFENLKNVVRRYLEKSGTASNDLIEPSRSKRNKLNPNRKSRKFELVLDFPAGTYG